MNLRKRRKPFRVVITREDGKPYLIRFNLFQCNWFTIKLHKMITSDDACLHDHPWGYMSIILWGGYIEYAEIERKNRLGSHFSFRSKLYHPGNILLRSPNWKHRLEIHQTCYTLVFTTGRKREWGFWTKKGWVEWFNYRQGENMCE